jgi:hypothetical protein
VNRQGLDNINRQLDNQSGGGEAIQKKSAEA